jgi:hypothetical protein
MWRMRPVWEYAVYTGGKPAKPAEDHLQSVCGLATCVDRTFMSGTEIGQSLRIIISGRFRRWRTTMKRASPSRP